MNIKWKNWCRMCGSFGITTKLEISADIKHHFKISDKSAKVCEECNLYLFNFQVFTEKSTKVNQLFQELVHEGEDVNTQRLNELREKFDLEPMEIECEIDRPGSKNLEDFLEIKQETTEIPNQIFCKDAKDQSTKSKSESSRHQKIKRTRQTRSQKQEPTEKKEIDTLLSCHLCSHVFRNIKKLENHCKIKHKCTPQVPCKCGATISDCSSYERHSISCLNYHCDLCPKKYDTKKQIERHISSKHIVHPESFVCSTCNKEFKTKYLLKSHKSIHLPDYIRLVHSCPECDLKFSSQCKVKAHINRAHTVRERSHICEICGKGFKCGAHLANHQMYHRETSDFLCDVCSKGYKTKGLLLVHIQTHGPRKWLCEVCNMGFKRRYILKKHMLVHSDARPFKCPYEGCDKDFKRKCDMNSHIISSAHLNIQKHQCTVCNQAFNSLSNCIRHKRQLHRTEYEIEKREKETKKKPESH